MFQFRVVVSFLVVSLSVFATATVTAQDYPTRPIRIIAAGPGGGTDFTARVIAQGISGSLGQVVVENRPSGLIPNETVAKATPDGYTLLLSPGGLWIGPLLGKVPYDPVRDFTPITL